VVKGAGDDSRIPVSVWDVGMGVNAMSIGW